MPQVYEIDCPPLPQGVPPMPKTIYYSRTGGILDADFVLELPAGLTGKIKIYVNDIGTVEVQVKQDKCIYIIMP